MNILMLKGHTLFICDTHVNLDPSAEQIAEMTLLAAEQVRRFGITPRVALLSHSTYGNPMHQAAAMIRDAVAILDQRKVDFEYDGEMSPDVALEPALRALYPFCRLTGPANVLVMPGLHSAHITSRLVARLGQGSTIGPLLIGMTHPAQIVPMDASVSQIVDIACLAAHQAVPLG
jgi:malate dehydrogenase (oxaloacetate-decarboxylating)(NADP+)